jgi:hypothetical protein
MRVPSIRAAKTASVIAAPLAILAAAGLIWSASNAAFSATTRNSGNNWATGSVALTDDDAGSARFQVNNMLPGQTETKCIKVTADASAPGVVRNYALNAISTSSVLSDHVMLSGTYGTGGGFGSCTGYVAAAPAGTPVSLTTLALNNSYATAGAGNPTGDWAVPAGVSSRTFQVTWTFDASGLSQAQLDTLQGTHTGIDMQWELQNS